MRHGESTNMLEAKKDQLPADSERGVLRKLRSALKDKMMLMAFTGFITLGGPIGESYADQLKIAKHDKGVPHFMLETGVTEKGLLSFEAKLNSEEPEFIEWLDKFETNFLANFTKYEESILALEEEEIERAKDLMVAGLELTQRKSEEDFTKEQKRVIEGILRFNNQVIHYLKEQPELLKQYHNFFRSNLYTILLSALALNDSPKTRAALINSNTAPGIYFSPHDIREFSGPVGWTIVQGFLTDNDYVPSGYDKDSNPVEHLEIGITPMAIVQLTELDNSTKIEIDQNYYLSSLIHEVLHAFFTAAKNKQTAYKNSSYLNSSINEGVVQNTALEIMEYLHRLNKDIKPAVGFFYDESVVITSILQAILKFGGKPESISTWHSFLSGDKEFIKDLRQALKELNLDDTIADDFMKLNHEYSFRIGGPTPQEQVLIKLLAKLRLGGVELSPDFIKNILTANRIYDCRGKNVGYMNEETSKWFKGMLQFEQEIGSTNKIEQ